MQTLIIGCGYLGGRVARRWAAAGEGVSVLTRSAERAQHWREVGLQPHVGDVLSPDSLRRLPECDVLLHAVGYDRGSDVDKRQVYVDGLRHVIEAVGDRVGRFLYISSSSVYGQEAGEWVDEASLTEPKTAGGRICLEAEQLLRESALGRSGRAVILRLSGIYGPGRWLARVESLRSGTPLAGSPDAWLNLIHVDDAATAVLAAAGHPSPEPLYLVSDDRPVMRGDYYGQLARLVDAPPPVFDAALQPRHGSGLNKRCCNRRVKASLGVAWRYPTLDEGLQQSLGSRLE